MRINNYGFLFNSNYLNNKNMFNNLVNNISNMISDYACIKTGAYNKLISAYYDKVDTDKQKSYKTYDSAGNIIENMF